MNPSRLRNFCVVSHIDHGKTTLTDRFLELTGTVKTAERYLDSNPIEQERGITIKLAPVRMHYSLNTIPYILNLIDTPGHVDFAYEVSRSLAACEGAILLVDATAGIQAQTLANAYKAINENLVLIPVINKIDLPNAEIEPTKLALIDSFGFKREEILTISAKTGANLIQLIKVGSGKSAALVKLIVLPERKSTRYSTDGLVLINSRSNSRSNRSWTTSACSKP